MIRRRVFEELSSRQLRIHVFDQLTFRCPGLVCCRIIHKCSISFQRLFRLLERSLSRSAATQQCIGENDQHSHDGDQYDLARFAGLCQSRVDDHPIRVVPDCGCCSHVKEVTRSPRMCGHWQTCRFPGSRVRHRPVRPPGEGATQYIRTRTGCDRYFLGTTIYDMHVN